MLPIESIVEPLLSQLDTMGRVVLIAEPGAGKTTVVPQRIGLDSRFQGRKIVVIQPRRLAATSVARFVASEMDTTVGGKVGYHVRHDRKFGPQTKLLFVTTGIALRRLHEFRKQQAIFVVDEFHERSIELDAIVALLRDDMKTSMVVMSATMDGGSLAEYLDCEVINCEGRTFPVDINYRPSTKPTADAVVAAVEELFPLGDGRTLVFLPTVASIFECERKLKRKYEVAALHGGLSIGKQQLVVGEGNDRKIILSTNIAETSVTVPSVDAVIDSGLRNLVVQTESTKLQTVTTISQASAIQRMGRAGRQRDGRCFRLYNQAQMEKWPAYDRPEILETSLAGLMLRIASLGYHFEELDWLDTPTTEKLLAAEAYLHATEAWNGEITPLGKRMTDFPLSVRASRFLVAAERDGCPKTGSQLASLLDVAQSRVVGRLEGYDVAMHDPLKLGDALWDGDRLPWRERGVAQVKSSARQLLSGNDTKTPNEKKWLLAAYGDSIAKRTGGNLVRMASGETAVLPQGFAPKDDLFVVSELVVRRGKINVQAATPVTLEDVYEHCLAFVNSRTHCTFNAADGRVSVDDQTMMGAVVLDSQRIHKLTQEQTSVAAAELFVHAKKRPLPYFFGPELANLLCRVEKLSEVDVPDEMLWGIVSDACAETRTLSGLQDAKLYDHLWASLAPHWKAIAKHSPKTIDMPRRKNVKVNYEIGKPPWIASRIQDFFGMKETPQVAGQTLTLHLLAPNRRPVQVTSDLASFWKNHYPSLRKELKRKYHKHSWPEDPTE